MAFRLPDLVPRPPLRAPARSPRKAAFHSLGVRGSSPAPARAARGSSPVAAARSPRAERPAPSWTLVRHIIVRQALAADAAARIKVPIEGPGSDRIQRVLYLDAEAFEALSMTVDFRDFDVAAFGDTDSGSRSELTENALAALVSQIGTWVHATPSEEDNAFALSVQVRLGQAIRKIIKSSNLSCSWRLCRGIERRLPEQPFYGVNSVAIDGVREARTPAGFKLDLMQHQRRSLAWMIMREQFGKEDLYVSEQRGDRVIECNGLDLRFEIRTEEACSLRGGLLCDVVGSGKTATVLALILQNSRHLSIGTTITKATLVLCPANVHAQWLAEVRKFCPDAFKVVSLQTLEDLRDIDVDALVDVDLIVAPYDIFAVGPPAPALLETICLHRIVLDEFHELTSRSPANSARNDQILAALRSLKVEKRWGMSGTPETFLNSGASVAKAGRFFLFDVSVRSSHVFAEQCCRQARIAMPVEVHEHLVTVHQTAGERAIYLQELADLGLPQNMELHELTCNAAETRTVFMLCSHFTTVVGRNALSAEASCEMMLREKRSDVKLELQPLMHMISSSHYADFEEGAQDVLKASCSNIAWEHRVCEHSSHEAQRFFEASGRLQLACCGLFDVDAENWRLSETLVDMLDASKEVQASFEGLMSLKAMQDRLHENKVLQKGVRGVLEFPGKLLQRCGRTIDAHRRFVFFKRTWDRLNGQGDSDCCPICLEDVTSSSAYILFCGHVLCVACAKQLESGTCPVCRLQIPQLRAHSILLRPYGAVPPQARTNVSRPERAHWSSKLLSFVETLEQIHSEEPGAKAIVFTQWESLRLQISHALTEIGVRHLSLEGNIFERTRTLHDFQSDVSVSLLLLSLENSASGTNLTVASHVFLMHPMVASSQEMTASYEAQAVGRVARLGQQRAVHVWRFVAAHTVEEKVWLSNICVSDD